MRYNSVANDGKKEAKEEGVDGTSAQELEVSNDMIVSGGGRMYVFHVECGS